MIDREEFERFYINEIEPEINNIKKEEKEIKIKAIKKESPYLLLICIVLYILGHLWISLIFILPYFFVKLLNVAQVDYGSKVFVETIMPKIVKFVKEELEYSYNGIDIEKFNKVGYIKDNIDWFNSKHLITGKKGKVSLELSDITASKETKSGSKTRGYTLYSGFLLTADFNKEFKYNTIIFRDYIENIFGQSARSLQENYVNNDLMKLIKLENKEFEEKFIVFGENPVESRYILTPDFMENILKISKKNEIKFISFSDSKIHIGIKRREEYFSYKIREKLIGMGDVYEFCNKIKNTISIIEDLDLNTRIWSKE